MLFCIICDSKIPKPFIIEVHQRCQHPLHPSTCRTGSSTDRILSSPPPAPSSRHLTTLLHLSDCECNSQIWTRQLQNLYLECWNPNIFPWFCLIKCTSILSFLSVSLSTFCPAILSLVSTQSLAFFLLEIRHIESLGVQSFLDKSGALWKHREEVGRRENGGES